MPEQYLTEAQSTAEYLAYREQAQERGETLAQAYWQDLYRTNISQREHGIKQCNVHQPQPLTINLTQKENSMKQTDVFESKYLRAADLGGEIATVTIVNVTMEEVGQDKEKRPVVYFKGSDKGMILNKTNWSMIVDVTGEDDSDNWTGKSIQIYEGEAMFKGEMVPALRVKRRQTATKGTSTFAKAATATVKADEDPLEGLPEKTQRYLRSRTGKGGKVLTPADEFDSNNEENPFFDADWLPF